MAWFLLKRLYFIQRFFPSEFGNDVDRVHAVEPAKSMFAVKLEIRRAIEAEGIPYTYVVSNLFDGIFLSTLAQPGAIAPPRDRVTILGDGNSKGEQHLSGYNGSFLLYFPLHDNCLFIKHFMILVANSNANERGFSSIHASAF